MDRNPTLAAALLASALLLSPTAFAQDAAKTDASQAAAATVEADDLLNATLWMQSAVEYKANSLAVYALAKMILDADETAIDNSAYEAGLAVNHRDYSSKDWAEWTAAAEAKAVPGAVEYAKYADSKGVKVFYVTNRKAAEEEATRKNMEALGFPMGGNVDTFLTRGEKEEWSSDKTSRRDFVGKDYRVLALIGDNLGDFIEVDDDIEARAAAFDEVKDHFAQDWFMLANPTYGSWEPAAYGGNFKLSREEKRRMKMDALESWVPGGQ